jgi:hypothetical protein
MIRGNIVRCTTGKGIDCGSETWSSETLIATEKDDQRVLIGGHHLVERNLIEDNAQCGIAAWNTDHVRIIGNVVRGNATTGGETPERPNSLADDEAAGIKVHAFRNGLIEGNLVVDNPSFGIWLDNGWENARVTRNVTVGNRGAGIFVEFGFGPALVDHNLSACNGRLWPPYFGDGIYTHDASGVTITHNTILDNAHYGVEQRVAAERKYWPDRLSETSNEDIAGNLFFGNRDGVISLPFDSPRSHDNHSDHNAVEPGAIFVINNNMGRIPAAAILKACRERLHTADLPDNQRPDADPKRVATLSLPAWRTVMKMDQNSTPLPAGFRMHLDKGENLLQIDLPSVDATPMTPAGPADDFDLVSRPLKAGEVRVGAIQHLQSGRQTIRLWPLPAAGAAAASASEDGPRPRP